MREYEVVANLSEMPERDLEELHRRPAMTWKKQIEDSLGQSSNEGLRKVGIQGARKSGKNHLVI
jgi:hypothetical protein